jgi:D-alanine-D-alanine ligase
MPEGVAHIATARVKWNPKYQQKHGIETGPAPDLTEDQVAKIRRICKRVYRALNMSGYGRIDMRMNAQGQVFVIEANANPNLEYGEDLAESAEAAGISYEQLLSRIISLGRSYAAPWQQ